MYQKGHFIQLIDTLNLLLKVLKKTETKQKTLFHEVVVSFFLLKEINTDMGSEELEVFPAPWDFQTVTQRGHALVGYQ